ncbi:MAG TPA: phosphotriesterase-related protein [Syntrophomonas sp.]|nr:phosphotriesterase-related protein [Syntrophomonas sp.]
MAKMINTVTGPISSDALGKTYIHEHVLFGYPGFQGDLSVAPFHWDDVLQYCIDIIKPIMDNYGLQTVVDATPNECGRNVRFLQAVAETTGLNIIPASGYYFEEEGAPAYFKQRATLTNILPEIIELLTTEVTTGIEGTGIRAGVFKVASSKGEITPYEEVFFKAAAQVSSREGIPIITHTQEGTMGPQQAELLISAGADPKRVAIGHMCGSTDIQYHLNTLAKGVYISFDRFGLQALAGCPTDSVREAVLAGLCAAGYADRIMLGHDAILSWIGRPPAVPEQAFPLIANWNWNNMMVNVIPALKGMGVSDEQINLMMVENPKRFFGY